MSKILVIPDTHLKHKMFDLADKIMQDNKIDYAVQLGDNFDDFYCYEEQYRKHNTRMLQFKWEHPNTIWLWGNHEISYLLNQPVTGNEACGRKYAELYQETYSPSFIHIHDHVIFSHAGIFEEFVQRNNLQDITDVEELVYVMNQLPMNKYWDDTSPLWARPRYNRLTEAKSLKNYLQITGHTPEKSITLSKVNKNSKKASIIFTDTFSTDWGKKCSDERMMIIDTRTQAFKEVEIDYRKEFGDGRDY